MSRFYKWPVLVTGSLLFVVLLVRFLGPSNSADSSLRPASTNQDSTLPPSEDRNADVVHSNDRAAEAPQTVNEDHSRLDEKAVTGVEATMQTSSPASTVGSTVTSSKAPTSPAASGVSDSPAVVAAEFKKSKNAVGFKGVTQVENSVMVSAVHFKTGESADTVTVDLIQLGRNTANAGRVWVVGEYVQHGTTGYLLMPSHKDLRINPDGKALNPKAGLTYSFDSRADLTGSSPVSQETSKISKKFTIPHPGFEGDELTGVRIGLMDAKSGALHEARVSVVQQTKKNSIRRARVDVP